MLPLRSSVLFAFTLSAIKSTLLLITYQNLIVLSSNSQEAYWHLMTVYDEHHPPRKCQPFTNKRALFPAGFQCVLICKHTFTTISVPTKNDACLLFVQIFRFGSKRSDLKHKQVMRTRRDTCRKCSICKMKNALNCVCVYVFHDIAWIYSAGIRSWDVDLKSCNLNLYLQEFLTHHTASFKGAGKQKASSPW